MCVLYSPAHSANNITNICHTGFDFKRYVEPLSRNQYIFLIEFLTIEISKFARKLVFIVHKLCLEHTLRKTTAMPKITVTESENDFLCSSVLNENNTPFYG